MAGYLSLIVIAALFALTPKTGRWARRRWLAVAAISFVATLYLSLFVDDGIPAPACPGGGGEGIHFLFVWIARALSAAIFVASAIAFGRSKRNARLWSRRRL